MGREAVFPWDKLNTKPIGSSILVCNPTSEASVRASAYQWGKGTGGKIAISKVDERRYRAILKKRGKDRLPRKAADGRYRALYTLKIGETCVLRWRKGKPRRLLYNAVAEESARAKGFKTKSTIVGLKVVRTW